MSEHVRVGSRHCDTEYSDSWNVDWRDGSHGVVRTRFVVLRWDDVVKRHWGRSLAQASRDGWRVYIRHLSPEMVRRLWRHARACLWMGLLPAALLTASLSLSALLVWSLAAAGVMPLWLALLAFPLLGIVVWRLAEGFLNTEWMLRLYGFTWQWGRNALPDLDARLNRLTDVMLDEVLMHKPAGTLREVLVVGHSFGSILAASVLARALQREGEQLMPSVGNAATQWGLLSLGHCIPLLAWQPSADRFRHELDTLVDTPGLVWWDFSAPVDWAAFSQTPPWLTTGGAIRRRQTSPRFHKILSPQRYQRLRAHRRRMHMQYLVAPDLPGEYDFVTLTASPVTLSERDTAWRTRTPAAPVGDPPSWRRAA